MKEARLTVEEALSIVPLEHLRFLKDLHELGPLSKRRIVKLGLSYDTIRKLEQIGILEQVDHPTLVKYKVSDKIVDVGS